MKRIAILGSTGSIGQSTLDVIRNFPGKFRVVGLSTNSNVDILLKQIKEFHPAFVCVGEEDKALNLKHKLARKTRLFTGEAGLKELVRLKHLDEVVLAIGGSAALPPLLAAIDNGRNIALANKEALVMAGPMIMNKVKKHKIKLIPIDSEQSAIWQCLDGEDRERLKNIYLTASGGPFRQTLKSNLNNISISRVLKHPKWKMGRKITVDSANLMNKGLEVLEAVYLFGVAPQKIKILIHPEAIIHSMVEFVDGIILAQLSVTDMRIPIQYALSYPERFPNRLAGVDFFKLGRMNFQKPDFKKFPCLELAYRAADEGGTMPCVLNAANEISVHEFLTRRLNFISIPKVIEKILNIHKNRINPDLDDILRADRWAREEAFEVINKLRK